MVKNPHASAGDARDMGLIPELEVSFEGGHATYSIFLPGESHG